MSDSNNPKNSETRGFLTAQEVDHEEAIHDGKGKRFFLGVVFVLLMVIIGILSIHPRGAIVVTKEVVRIDDEEGPPDDPSFKNHSNNGGDVQLNEPEADPNAKTIIIATDKLRHPRQGENLIFYGPFTFEKPLLITEFLPLANASFVHHLIIYKSQETTNHKLGFKVGGQLPGDFWEEDRIVFAWARTGQKTPRSFRAPPGSGFWVGPGTDAKELYINAHFEVPEDLVKSKFPVSVAFKLTYVEKKPRRAKYWRTCTSSECEHENSKGLAVQILEEHRFRIPPKSPDYVVRHVCKISRDVSIFAYRNHAHTAGREFSTSWYRDGIEIGPLVNRSVQDAQVFYPFPGKGIQLRKDDVLELHCHFNTMSRTHFVTVGADLSRGEEMCNQYLMYYPHHPAIKKLMCVPLSSRYDFKKQYLPVPFPIESKIPESSSLGQVSGVAVTSNGNKVYFFARRSNNYVSRKKIRQDTIFEYDTLTNTVTKSFGKDMFVTPHGLYCDLDGYLWATDTSLHQVFRINPLSGKVVLTLGEPGKYGDSNERFNRPTDVVVDITRAEAYVSDGYGNSRVIVFDVDSGEFVRKWGKNRGTDRNSMDIVHSISFDPVRDTVYVADRENGRVKLFDRQGKLLNIWKSEFTDRSYLDTNKPWLAHLSAVSYSKYLNLVFTLEGVHVVARHPETGEVKQHWGSTEEFIWPHDVEVGLEEKCPVVYTAELDAKRVQRFTLQSKLS